jgi:hypothetical protein
VVASASSIYLGNPAIWGPNYAIDGLVLSGGTLIYHSDEEVLPWFQLDFVEPIVVTGAIITNRCDSSGERFKNVAIYVGDQPAVIGALSTNPECAKFVGPSDNCNIDKMICTEPLVGHTLQVQIWDDSNSYLQINEIEVL